MCISNIDNAANARRFDRARKTNNTRTTIMGITSKDELDHPDKNASAYWASMISLEKAENPSPLPILILTLLMAVPVNTALIMFGEDTVLQLPSWVMNWCVAVFSVAVLLYRIAVADMQVIQWQINFVPEAVTMLTIFLSLSHQIEFAFYVLIVAVAFMSVTIVASSLLALANDTHYQASKSAAAASASATADDAVMVQSGSQESLQCATFGTHRRAPSSKIAMVV